MIKKSRFTVSWKGWSVLKWRCMMLADGLSALSLISKIWLIRVLPEEDIPGKNMFMEVILDVYTVW